MSCDGFLLRLTARCGAEILAGGLCQAGYKQQSLSDLKGLSYIAFQKSDDIYDIDFRLAQAIQQCCGSYIWAVGVTACLHRTGAVTGGVIGAPHMGITSAAGQAEAIGNGLYMRAFPGGPGYVAQCNEASLLQGQGFDACLLAADKKDRAVAEYLRGQGISTFFVVTDGTGYGAEASFILEVEGKGCENDTINPSASKF